MSAGQGREYLPDGYRHAMPYELVLYWEANPGLNGHKKVWRLGEYDYYDDHGGGADSCTYLTVNQGDGTEQRFQSETVYREFERGTVVLYVKLGQM